MLSASMERNAMIHFVAAKFPPAPPTASFLLPQLDSFILDSYSAASSQSLPRACISAIHSILFGVPFPVLSVILPVLL